jgi:hypothetical protein
MGATNAFYIGRDPSNASRYWNGTIDNVRITNGYARDISTIPSTPFPHA